MENLDFGRGHGRNFDNLTTLILKFWPWSWSKIFDHMTMTPGCRPNGQKIMVALTPHPPPPLKKAFKFKRKIERYWILMINYVRENNVCGVDVRESVKSNTGFRGAFTKITNSSKTSSLCATTSKLTTTTNYY